jgi:amino acid transporter
MVAAALPAGQATLDLFAPSRAQDAIWATGFGALWFLAVLLLVTVGITASAKAQMFFTVLEVGALVLISVLAIAHARAAPVAPFAWNWFSPASFGDVPTFAAGMLVATFYFSGWDVSANLAEETVDAKLAAGLGGLVGVGVIFGLFLLAQVAVQMTLTSEEIQAGGSNLLPVLAKAALPSPWSAIAVLAVLFSAVATIETQILQCTRLLFAMARDGVIGASMGELHPRFQTPWLAGFAVAAVSLLLFAASATVPSVNELMSGLISAIGLQISFYYGLAAIACAATFWRNMLTDWRALLFAGVIPVTSALFLAGVAIHQLPQVGWRISLFSVGSILTGLLPLWFYRRRLS